ncbi:hypothetical protein OKW29_001821 [Paraburkholderia sp. CI3]
MFCGYSPSIRLPTNTNGAFARVLTRRPALPPNLWLTSARSFIE